MLEGDAETDLVIPYVDLRGRRKKNTTKLNHSTVTECSSSVVLLNSPPSTEVYLTFDVDVIASHLFAPAYNDYHQFLYETISSLRAKHWSFPKIADWLNDNGYSIVKKKRVKDVRLTKRHKPRLSNFGLRFIDRTLINQN